MGALKLPPSYWRHHKESWKNDHKKDLRKDVNNKNEERIKERISNSNKLLQQKKVERIKIIKKDIIDKEKESRGNKIPNIVGIRVSTPPTPKHYPLFLPNPYLKSENCPRPQFLFRQCPPQYLQPPFVNSPSKSQIF